MRSIRSRAPVASSPLIRRVMQANMPRDTIPEVALRSALHSAGLRYRKDSCPEPSLRCKADVVFPRERVCIFVDGCFWHGCPIHFRTPRTNSSWWEEKISDNRRRDKTKRARLRRRGWVVMRVWEHEITPDNLGQIVARIATMVSRRRKTACKKRESART